MSEYAIYKIFRLPSEADKEKIRFNALHNFIDPGIYLDEFFAKKDYDAAFIEAKKIYGENITIQERLLNGKTKI